MIKRLRIFAGPNGSGKTSLYSYLISQHYFNPYYYINADDIAKALPESGFSVLNWPINISMDDFIFYFSHSSFLPYIDLERIKKQLEITNKCFRWSGPKENISYVAASIADFLREKMLDSDSSFSCETVFSHPSKLDFMKKAREKGFKVYLYFVSTENALINIDRVQNRVQQGGHGVPKEKIESRYSKTLDNFYDAVKLSDKSFIFDNSKSVSGISFQNFAETNGKKVTILSDNVPEWFNTCFLQKV